MRKHMVLLAALAATLALAAVPALAAKGGNAAAAGGGGNGGGGNASSIWVDTDSYRSDGVMNYKDTMSFGYTTSEQYASIQLQCFQNGFLVFSASHAAYEGGYGYGQPFQLGPSYAWSGGAAQCVGILGHRASNGRYVEDASTNFDVAA